MKDEDNCIIKERITVATYLLDNSHITLLSSVNKIVRFLRENHQFLPLRLMVHLWKDGCTAKFHSRYTFSLFTHFYVWLQIAWYYNKPYYDKSPMDGIKRVIFTNVKVKKGINSLKEFSDYANQRINSITSLYLPANQVMHEPEPFLWL